MTTTKAAVAAAVRFLRIVFFAIITTPSIGTKILFTERNDQNPNERPGTIMLGALKTRLLIKQE